MTVNVQEVLVVDVVLAELQLLRNEKEIFACSEAMEAEIVTDGIVLATQPRAAAPVQGQVLRFRRDRMTVETSAARTRIAREYPAGIEDVGLVSRLIAQAIEATDLEGNAPAAFGFNIQIVYDQDSGEPATHYLGRRLFHPAENLRENWVKVGGFGKLIFQEGNRRWTIALEPRMQDPNTTKVFLDVNLHVPEARLPSLDDVDSLLREVWSRAHSLIEAIDGTQDD